MKLEIKLKDPELCSACPALRYSDWRGRFDCRFFDEELKHKVHEKYGFKIAIRPLKCIKENGK